MDWPLKQRLRAIEIILYWHGRLNTGDIIKTFGISRTQVSKDIKQYITTYPGNAYYHFKKQAYLKANPFKLHFTHGTIDEYIDHISRMLKPNSNTSIEKLSLHYSPLKPIIAGAILQAIEHKLGVNILYGSMGTPEGQQRVIYPHSLVDSGFRWHVRAYCTKRKEFRDFNLGRILGQPEAIADSLAIADKKHDTLWNKKVNVSFRANPIFSEAQQKLIQTEFDIPRKIIHIKVRACLIHYTLQRYQIDSEQLENPPATQTLVIDNNKEIKPFLFG